MTGRARLRCRFFGSSLHRPVFVGWFIAGGIRNGYQMFGKFDQRVNGPGLMYRSVARITASIRERWRLTGRVLQQAAAKGTERPEPRERLNDPWIRRKTSVVDDGGWQRVQTPQEIAAIYRKGKT
jgi:hypothetical protein